MNIFNKLKELSFPVGHYVVVGSGLMAALGIREARDLDIAVDKKLFEHLKKSKKYIEEIKFGRLFLVTDDVEIIPQLNWDDYSTTISQAISSAKKINGFPFLNIEETIKFKRALGREKDFNDIKLIEDYLER